MTVEQNDTVERYTISGVGPYAFTFRVFDKNEVTVTAISAGLVSTSLSLTTHYTVSGVNDEDGGSITLVAEAATTYAGYTLDIRSNTAEYQPTSIRNQGRFLPEIHEDVFDRLSRQIQDLSRKVRGAIRYPDDGISDAVAPAISSRAGRYLYSNATTGAFEWATAIIGTALSQSIFNLFLADSDQYKRTAGEIAGGVTPTNYAYLPGHAKRYGALGDGSTNDTAALLRMIAAMHVSGGMVHFDYGAIYMVDSSTLTGLNFSGKTNFKVFGNNATLKVLSGESVVGGFGVLYFTNSQDGYIENLTVDTNRANRTPANVGAWGICVQDSCARLHFKNCSAINGVSDGWTINTSDEATLATYPTDITLEDCVADNCYRNGISVIGSLRLTIDGGSYSNTNGGSPETGIDVEPDVGFTHGNRDLVIRDVRVRSNDGKGIVITGPDGSPNVNITIINPLCDANDDGHIHVAQGTNVYLHGGRYGDLVGSASFGAVQFGDPSTTVRNVTVQGLDFADIGASIAPACLRITGDVEGRVSVGELTFAAIDCRALLVEANAASIDGISVLDCSGVNPSIQISGSRTRLRNVLTDTTEAASVYVTGSDVELDGVTVIDFGANAAAGIQLETGASGSILRNISLHQRTSIPGGAYGIRYNGVAPRIIQNVAGKSAGTDFTVSTLFSFVSGISGAWITHCNPSVTENSGTGSIASGATTATVNHGLGVTPAAKDFCITFTEQGTSDYGRWWISGIGATQFTLNVSADPGASNLDFAWSVKVRA